MHPRAEPVPARAGPARNREAGPRVRDRPPGDGSGRPYFVLNQALIALPSIVVMVTW